MGGWKSPAPGDLSGEDRANDREEVLAYLKRFELLPSDANGDNDELATGLTNLQSTGGLTQTGLYDKPTAKLMEKSRCGCHDPLGSASASDEVKPKFVLNPNTWNHTRLTYRFDSFCKELTQEQCRTAITDAFQRWSNVTPLTFVEVPAGAVTDIQILFAAGNHGDNSPFDGVGNVLAHAYYPPPNGGDIAGDAHFDEDETWTPDFLLRVAIHEFGHSLGLEHSKVPEAIMWPYVSSRRDLHADDIAGIQAKYGRRTKGWFTFQLAPPPIVAPKSSIAATSRIQTSMEIWWIAPNGSVQDAYWYQGQPWNRFQLAGPGSAAPGGIAAVSRIPKSMEVWWVAPNGSIQDGYWYEGSGAGWKVFQLSGPGSGAPGSGVAAVSRIPTSMEVWWVAPNGSVQDAYYYEGAGWRRFELAGPGSAVVGSITAVSRIPSSMEVWWISPGGSVEGAYWYEGKPWGRYQIAPNGSAALKSGLTVVSRIPGSMELFWIAPNSSVQHAWWYGNGWSRGALTAPGTAAIGGIKALSRVPARMDIWWTSIKGSIETAYYIDNRGWAVFQLAPNGSAAIGSGIGGVSRLPITNEIFLSAPDLSLRDYYFYE